MSVVTGRPAAPSGLLGELALVGEMVLRGVARRRLALAILVVLPAFPREMEGTLILFLLAGLQAVTNPFGLVAKVLPFWSSREIGTVAVDGPEEASLLAGILHAAVVVLVCAAGTALQRSGARIARPVP